MKLRKSKLAVKKSYLLEHNDSQICFIQLASIVAFVLIQFCLVHQESKPQELVSGPIQIWVVKDKADTCLHQRHRFQVTIFLVFLWKELDETNKILKMNIRLDKFWFLNKRSKRTDLKSAQLERLNVPNFLLSPPGISGSFFPIWYTSQPIALFFGEAWLLFFWTFFASEYSDGPPETFFYFIIPVFLFRYSQADIFAPFCRPETFGDV